MVNYERSLLENPALRGAGALAGFLAIVLVVGDVPPRQAIPPTIVFGGVLVHGVADEAMELPSGSGHVVLGTALLLASGYLLLVEASVAAGTVVSLAGAWFVFDGATAARNDRGEPADEHRVGSGSRTGEAMLRAQTRVVVYRALATSSGPRSASELATELDLTEGRVTEALEFLQDGDRVESVEGGYRAVPTRWGRLAPVVQFAVWIPKRLVQPVLRLR